MGGEIGVAYFICYLIAFLYALFRYHSMPTACSVQVAGAGFQKLRRNVSVIPRMPFPGSNRKA
jgi:hypothetical protein